MKKNDLLELRDLLSVAHHVPGRIRLRLNPKIRNHPAAKEFEHWNTSGTGILATRLNSMARSLVIDYDPKQIHAGEFEEFLETRDPDRTTKLLKTFAKLFGVTN
ncbi:hypothetical protein [Desulfovibrio inopinatus]|uniref:hypothetical protein n=1 Tax=Desulfovibrio inopinatus TaxID=102109 RepID=UPI0003F816A2|nr:hypothetical protein [Desulfovibrio inopinatus]